jgi:hypothetical protein
MKPFKTIYVVEPAHSINALKKYADDVVFISDLGISVSCLYEHILGELSEFNPETDALIPMGRASACTIAGIVVVLASILNMKKFNIPKVFISIGVYKDERYFFERIELE